MTYQREHPDIGHIVASLPTDALATVVVALSRDVRKWVRVVTATGDMVSGALPAEPIAGACATSAPDGSLYVLFRDRTVRKFTVGAASLTQVWATPVGSGEWLAGDTGWIAAPGWHGAHVLILDPATGSTVATAVSPTPIQAALGLGALFVCGGDKVAQIRVADGVTIDQLDLTGVRGPEGAYWDFCIHKPVFVGADWAATIDPAVGMGAMSATYAGRYTARVDQAAPVSGAFIDRAPYFGPWWEGATYRAPVSFRPGRVQGNDTGVCSRPVAPVVPPDPVAPVDDPAYRALAFVCAGDASAGAGALAGRYLGKWPLQTDLLASTGYDPVALSPTAAQTVVWDFLTLGGKQCVASIGTRAGPQVTLQYIASSPVRATARTVSVCVYTQATPVNTAIITDDIKTKLTLGVGSTASQNGYGDGTVLASIGAIMPINTWVHYTLTNESLQPVRLYVNGVLSATSAGNCADVCRVLTILYAQLQNDFLGNYFAIRNLRVYSRALSGAEAAAVASADLA